MIKYNTIPSRSGEGRYSFHYLDMILIRTGDIVPLALFLKIPDFSQGERQLLKSVTIIEARFFSFIED